LFPLLTKSLHQTSKMLSIRSLLNAGSPIGKAATKASLLALSSSSTVPCLKNLTFIVQRREFWDSKQGGLLKSTSSLKESTSMLKMYSTTTAEKEGSKSELPDALTKFEDQFGYIIEDKNSWEFDAKVTRYANELVSKEAKPLEAGVEVVELKMFLQGNEENSPNLFTRKDSRALWDEVYSYLCSTSKSHCLVTGNPGIGKSRSMTYLLRKLLREGKTVVYEARKDSRVFAFIPISPGIPEQKVLPTYKVFVVQLRTFLPGACAVLQDPDNFYLIDPGNPASITNVPAHTVLAASPNKAHYHEWVKRANTPMLCMPVWKKEELESMNKVLLGGNPMLSNEQLEERYNMIGGIPRYIFATAADYTKFIGQLDNSLKEIPFEIVVRAVEQGGELDASQSSTNRIPSILFQYTSQAPFALAKAKLQVASEHISVRLAVKYWNDIMNRMNPASFYYAQSSSALGNLLEGLAHALIPFGGSYEIKDLDKPSHAKGSKLKLNTVRMETVSGSWENFIEYCAKLPLSSSQRTVVARPESANLPVLDMMDAKDRAYQVTVSSKHGITAKQFQQLVDKIGANKQQPLQLYFVVPHFQFKKFKKQSLTGLKNMTVTDDDDNASDNINDDHANDSDIINADDDKEKKEKLKQLRGSLKQYALCLPKELPTNFKQIFSILDGVKQQVVSVQTPKNVVAGLPNQLNLNRVEINRFDETNHS
jgi:hypothetical protein